MNLANNGSLEDDKRDPNMIGYQQYTASICEKTLTPVNKSQNDPLAGIIKNRDIFMKAQQNATGGGKNSWFQNFKNPGFTHTDVNDAPLEPPPKKLKNGLTTEQEI